MNQIRWKERAELLGLIAIVASLIFVGLQIRQEQVIARSQLGSETFERLTDRDLLLADPEFAKAWVKMLTSPDDLTDAEMVQINGFLGIVLNSWVRECYLMQRGVFAECSYVVRVTIGLFGSKYAKSWWNINKPPSGATYPLPEWVDTAINELDPDSSLEITRSAKQGM